MLARANDDVQISSRAAHRSGVSTPLQPDSLAIARACLNSNLDRLVALHPGLAVTNRADRAVLSATSTASAGNFELHAATLLRDRSLAVTLSTLARLLYIALSMTVTARL